MAVGGDVAVFCVGNLQEIGSDARQADGLRWSSTDVRGRHSLKIEVIHHEDTREELRKETTPGIFASKRIRSVRIRTAASIPSPVHRPLPELTNEHNCAP